MQETGEAFMDQFHGRYGNPDRFSDNERSRGIPEYLHGCGMQGTGRLADRNERNQGIYDLLFKRLVVGRVQTPTLAMLAERQDKIEHFQKEAFYKVALTDGRLTVVSENIANEEAADLLASLCMDSEAVITQVKRGTKEKRFLPNFMI